MLQFVPRGKGGYVLSGKSFEKISPVLSGVAETGVSGDGTYYCKLDTLSPSIAYTVVKFCQDELQEDVSNLGDLVRMAATVKQPSATIDGSRVSCEHYNHPAHRQIIRSLNGYMTSDGSWKFQVARVFDFTALNRALARQWCVPYKLEQPIINMISERLDGFDGTISSLMSIPTSALFTVKNNLQSVTAKAKSKDTLEKKLASMGVETLYDLLFYLPKRYLDKSSPVNDLFVLEDGEECCLSGVITEIGEMGGNGGTVITVRTLGNTLMTARFFRQGWIARQYRENDEVLMFGKKATFNRKPYLSGSSIEMLDRGSITPIVPIYRQAPSKGVTTNVFVCLLRELLMKMWATAPESSFWEQGAVDGFSAVSSLHFPKSMESYHQAVNEWAEYELLLMQLLLLRDQMAAEERPGVVMDAPENKLQNLYISSLPYNLTGSQAEAVEAMNQRMSYPIATSTLLNGDVGSGKTTCANLVALRAVECGKQAAILSPTDVLARQLMRSVEKMSEALGEAGHPVKVAFFGAGLKAKEKREILQGVKSGEIQILAGTHAIFSDALEWNDLGVVIIDEQQKFGSEQRGKLLAARKDGLIPHIMLQTATPIPRSTAQIYYGDISLLMMTDKPAGRLPVVTEWVQEPYHDVLSQLTNHMWEDLSSELNKGNQVFIVTPMVYGSDKQQVANVEETAQSIKALFPKSSVGVIHGKMKKSEQQEVMSDFRKKKHQILVASTVVEVGVDIPDATRIVILSSDRLGAATLHQLRGRVGRSSKPSKCYLVCADTNPSTHDRMMTLVETNDGFEVAKRDLKGRGEGQIFGDSQHGKSDTKFVSVRKHAGVVAKCRERAKEILQSDKRDSFLREAEVWFNFETRKV